MECGKLRQNVLFFDLRHLRCQYEQSKTSPAQGHHCTCPRLLLSMKEVPLWMRVLSSQTVQCWPALRIAPLAYYLLWFPWRLADAARLLCRFSILLRTLGFALAGSVMLSRRCKPCVLWILCTSYKHFMSGCWAAGQEGTFSRVFIIFSRPPPNV